jgi:hypothetical protein
MSDEEKTPVYLMGEDDFKVGMHPEAEGLILLAFPKTNICLGFKLESAEKLHDELCLALALLGAGGEEVDMGALPPLETPQGRRQDN